MADNEIRADRTGVLFDSPAYVRGRRNAGERPIEQHKDEKPNPKS